MRASSIPQKGGNNVVSFICTTIAKLSFSFYKRNYCTESDQQWAVAINILLGTQMTFFNFSATWLLLFEPRSDCFTYAFWPLQITPGEDPEGVEGQILHLPAA